MTEPTTVTIPVSAASVRIADDLRAAILRGDIAPGERIRQEEVADRLGSSRIPVREALRMLEAEGLTEHEPHKGARVPKLALHEVDVIYQMRERLEPLCLIESMPALSAVDLEQLDFIQSEIEAGPTIEEFLRLDREFHLLSYSGCRIEHLSASITRLWNSTHHYRRLFMRLSGPGRMWVVNSEHRLLIDAISRQDAADAERIISGHIRRTRIELDRHPEVFA